MREAASRAGATAAATSSLPAPLLRRTSWINLEASAEEKLGYGRTHAPSPIEWKTPSLLTPEMEMGNAGVPDNSEKIVECNRVPIVQAALA